MTSRWASRVALGLIPAALAAWAIGLTYRAYLAHWQGSLRLPLIVGSLAGIAFIIVGTTIVALQDRAQARARSGS